VNSNADELGSFVAIVAFVVVDDDDVVSIKYVAQSVL
jgi:hypothetical protein